jgi:hypothetical protein
MERSDKIPFIYRRIWPRIRIKIWLQRNPRAMLRCSTSNQFRKSSANTSFISVARAHQVSNFIQQPQSPETLAIPTRAAVSSLAPDTFDTQGQDATETVRLLLNDAIWNHLTTAGEAPGFMAWRKWKAQEICMSCLWRLELRRRISWAT